MFKYLAYKFGQFCVRRLPIRVAYGIAVFLSDLHFLFSFRDRRAVYNNLQTILGPDKDISGMARKVFRNFGKYLVEFFRMEAEATQAFVDKNVEFINRHRLDEALQQGRGAIILTAHIGNWELGGVVLGVLGYPLLGIALPHRERPVNDLFNAQREARGLQVVPISQAVRKCFEALRANKVIAVLADRDFTANGERMKFLGKEAFIPKGAAIFACRTGAPILPAFLTRHEDDSFTMEIKEPIYAPVEKDFENEEGRIRHVMRQYTDVIEDMIRQDPTQWLMFREFWERTEPLGLMRRPFLRKRGQKDVHPQNQT